MKGFPIIDFFGPDKVPNEWTQSHKERLAIGISDAGSTVVCATGDEPSYLIHNATIQDFRVASRGTGISVPEGASFSIVTDIVTLRAARARVHILEYDGQGLRCGDTRVSATAAVHYVPGPNVRRIILTIRVAGTGEVMIQQFSATELSTRGLIPAGVHDMPSSSRRSSDAKGHVHALRRDLLSLEDVSSRIAKQMAGVLTEIESSMLVKESTDEVRQVSESTQDLMRDPLLHMARSLPISNGSHYFSERYPYRVAIISDEYMLNFYKDTFEEVTYVRPDAVEEVISAGFDLLLYVTCWKGVVDDEWRGVKFRERPAKALARLIEVSRARGIPTIFQSIEDPSNFDYFLPVAAEFDYIFTSDSDCVDRYRSTLGHNRVYYGEYGANPLLNNPIGNRRFTLNRAFFAGSYPKRYAERTADMEIIFDSILKAGPYLQIADRNWGNDEYAFPGRFAPYCMAPIPHDLLQQVHKLFRYSLNFNSIKASPTMCAMRVYELQAQGRGIISNYARSVLNKFPEIRIVARPENLDGYFAVPPSAEERRVNEQLVRNVMTDRTSFDIVGRMLDAIGLDAHGIAEVPTVTVYGDLADERVRASIARQSYSRIDCRDISEATSSPTDVSGLGKYFSVFSGDLEYKEHYLTDRVNAFKYVDVDFVSQSLPLHAEAEDEGVVHEFSSKLPAPELRLYASNGVGADAVLNGRATGLNGYMVAPYEAVAPAVGRRPVDSEDASPPELSVIVPVYENGRFLTAKCMPSIMRNSRWRNFEILLVDDGSRDQETRDICLGLAEKHANVRVHFYDDGGSGSASRPRNMGVALAQAPLVTFLDPDNEISDGGYDTLLELYGEAAGKHPELAFVSGYQVKVAEPPSITGRQSAQRLSIVADTKEKFFLAGKFPVVSTQAAVIRKAVFEKSALAFVEGAAGQDTLFGWELLLASEVAAFTDAAHLIYYAERTDSVTNSVGPKYFEKKLVMERAQVQALREHGIFDSYVANHLENFVRGWYLEKLNHVEEHNYEAALESIRSIVSLYDVDLDDITELAPTMSGSVDT